MIRRDLLFARFDRKRMWFLAREVRESDCSPFSLPSPFGSFSQSLASPSFFNLPVGGQGAVWSDVFFDSSSAGNKSWSFLSSAKGWHRSLYGLFDQRTRMIPFLEKRRSLSASLVWSNPSPPLLGISASHLPDLSRSRRPEPSGHFFENALL